MALKEIVKERIGLTSNYAAAYAAKSADVDVVAAYPITPQTTIIEKLAEFVADGELDAEFLPVESEHSALSAMVGASAAGARVFTATSSQGLEFMHEVLHIASGLRLPIVMATPGRALSAPISIHGDYQDIMNARESGWIIYIASTAQEVYDTIIQAYKVAEDPRVLLPVIVTYDGFLMSHTVEPVDLYPDEYVRSYIPKFIGNRSRLTPSEPITMGVIATPDWYYEIKYQVVLANKKSREVIDEVNKSFGERFGNKYDVIEKYMVDDADYVLITYGGASTGNAKEAVSKVREKGIKGGVLRVRLYRPFPAEDIAKAVEGAKIVGVIDRALSIGNYVEGPVYNDIASAFYTMGIEKPLVSAIHGISQRAMYINDFYQFIEKLKDIYETKSYPKEAIFLGLRQ